MIQSTIVLVSWQLCLTALPDVQWSAIKSHVLEDSMKLTVFGATGGTGRQVVEQALVAGHHVTALVRDPAKLDLTHAALTVKRGNVLEPEDVFNAVSGADAAVVSLGNTANNPEGVVAKGTANVVAAMQKSGVARLIVVTSLGVGESKDQVPFAFKALMATVLRKAMQDKEDQEKIVKASGLDWTIVRPGGLTDGPRSGQYRYGIDPKIVAGQVSRADVAEFVLKQLADTQFLRKAPAIT
jgi:putative NADH-flavin reductase